MTNLPTLYQEFIYKSRYSRWLPEQKRRENWDETVRRYFDFFEEHLKENCKYQLTKKEREELESAILNLEVMPSMRALMTAGEALKRDNIAGFNCTGIPIDSIRSFDECMYVLMCGSGVGFSVEEKHVSKLPIIAEEFYETDTTIIVTDSRIGWAKAFKELISLLYIGQIPKWDLSRLRPYGSILKTFGGRSSGPEPLNDLFNFCVRIFKSACGRRLSSIECHDIVCFIGKIIVLGGVRRSALISLSDLNDEKLRKAKIGNWWLTDSQRALANNSVCYHEKPDVGTFLKEWRSLYVSKAGERGIFNLQGSKRHIKKNNEFRKDLKCREREAEKISIVNPCGEALLRGKDCCNLSEIVIRHSDQVSDLKRKARIAAIFGTIQSTLTNFRYLSKEWQKNTEDERLLGVSLTGIMDSDLTNGTNPDELKKLLRELKEIVVRTNKEWAKKLGINESVATTIGKPSGTISQLVDSSSGIHARYSPYYIRTVRIDNKDPICQFMKDRKIPFESDVTKPDRTTVFSFPIKSPETSKFRDDLTAIDQLNFWLLYRENFTEHTVSCTIYVKEHEWLDVGAWVYNHFDDITGLSFLPHSDHVYRQAPYQEITKEQYEELIKKMPTNIDWSELSKYECEDNTVGNQTLACSGNSCEITDLTDDRKG